MSFDLFGGSNKSTTQQTSYQQQVGAGGGGTGGTLATGAYSGGGNAALGNGAFYSAASGGGVSVGGSGNTINSGSGTLNVTTDAAANSEAAFSTIDHLISMEAAAPGTAQTPSSYNPVIITGGGGSPGYGGADSGYAGSQSSGVNWVNLAVIAGAALTLIVFLRSGGKAA
jgi:hypothetical protein